jgi:hypothetical protein
MPRHDPVAAKREPHPRADARLVPRGADDDLVACEKSVSQRAMRVAAMVRAESLEMLAEIGRRRFWIAARVARVGMRGSELVTEHGGR